MRARLLTVLISSTLASVIPAHAQIRPSDRPLQVEWVYHVKYGYQGEWWKLCSPRHNSSNRELAIM
jgi:hypothetical protein